MSDLRAFFSTDWDAMTHADWSGLILAVVLAILMAGLYFWVFNPKNRDEFEQHCDFVNENENEHEHEKEEDMKREVEHGQTK
ncbi:MAG: hypothetical protein R8K48_08425 [Gallionella sp.]